MNLNGKVKIVFFDFDWTLFDHRTYEIKPSALKAINLLKNNGIKIRRKGGYETVVYFGDEVAEALHDYLEKRHHIIPLEGHENALFLSLQNRRITVRAVENLVKKYAATVTSLKKITPHKLRSTYGTSLYQETGDIYLVAEGVKRLKQ